MMLPLQSALRYVELLLSVNNTPHRARLTRGSTFSRVAQGLRVVFFVWVLS